MKLLKAASAGPGRTRKPGVDSNNGVTALPPPSKRDRERGSGVTALQAAGGGIAGGIAAVVRPITKTELSSTVDEIAQKVERWDGSRIVLIKSLQEAARNYGQVQLMKDTKNQDRQIAVKKMPNRWFRLSPKDFSAQYPTASELPWHDIGYVKLLGQRGFPYVCDLLGVWRSDTETFVATTFCSQGDLFGWCDDPSVKPPGAAREVQMLPILAQVVAAVRWLHELGIAHRDLSLENILLHGGTGANAQVKLIDFGMSTLARSVSGELRGKASYQAPEVHNSSEPVDTFLADAFSIGVIMYAMGAHDYPWTCTQRGKCQLFEFVSEFGFKRFLAKRKLRKGNGQVMDEVFSPQLIETIDALVAFDPKQRASLGEGCFSREDRAKPRRNIWELDFLRLTADQVPQIWPVSTPRPPSASASSSRPGSRAGR